MSFFKWQTLYSCKLRMELKFWDNVDVGNEKRRGFYFPEEGGEGGRARKILAIFRDGMLMKFTTVRSY